MNDGAREVKTGIEVVNATGVAFREAAELVTQVSSQVREISAVVQQMASGSQSDCGIGQKDRQPQQDVGRRDSTVSATTEEQLPSMEEIASSSEALSKLAAKSRV